jgi:hypothetical protein
MELGAFDYCVPYYRDGVEWVVASALREASGNEHTSYETKRTTLESVRC